MPLFRIETRTKKTAKKPAKRSESSAARGGSGAMAPLMAGAFVGILAVAGVTAFLVSRSRADQAQVGGDGAAQAPVTAPEATAAGALTPMLSDFPSHTIIAYVNGETYTMADLEKAARVARVLGSFTGDNVPDDGSPELRDFLVRLLSRQIDIMLIKQAAEREGVVPPEGDLDLLVEAFLGEVGVSRAQLDSLVASSPVTETDVKEWFVDARDINFYIQDVLMADRQPEERDTVVREWLAEQWEAGEVLVNFYDPDEVLATPTTPAGEGAG
jgi:hypothetical protein